MYTGSIGIMFKKLNYMELKNNFELLTYITLFIFILLQIKKLEIWHSACAYQSIRVGKIKSI